MSNKNSFLSIILFIFLGLVFHSQLLNANDKKTGPTQKPRVFILQIVEHPALNATRRGIEDFLKEQGIESYYESAQGNPALASQIAQKFVGNEPSVLIGIGTAASQALLAESHKQIPIVFSSVTDPIQAKLLSNLNAPPNYITGVSNYVDVAQSLKIIKGFLPKLSKLGVIYNPGEINSVILLEKLKQKAEDVGIEIQSVPAHSALEVANATKRLVNSVDAIFINNDNTSLSAFDAITKIANQHHVPVFVSDIDLTKQGAFVGMGPDQYQLGKQTGKMVYRILKGEKPNQLPVLFPEKIEIYVNVNTEKKMGIVIPEAIKPQVTQWVNP